jgi:hypothetical protein
VTLPFAISYAVLCVAQGATVAAPGPDRFKALARLRSGWWALVPVAAIVATVAGIRAAAGAADALTYLALVTTPPLAAVALGYAARGAGPARALAVVPAFAAAWVLRGSLVGEAASIFLTAAACVTLAGLLAAVAPAAWLRVGLILMSAADTALVVNQLLQAPNNVLNAAAPAAGLPQFQRAAFGSAVMGYGDLFEAALLGALLASNRARQREAALVTTALALAFGLLFFVVNTLPATVPVAATLVIFWAADRRGQARDRPRTGRGAARPRPRPLG